MAELSALAELGYILPILKSHINSNYTHKPVGVGLFPSGTVKFIADRLSAAYNHFLRFSSRLRSNIVLKVIYTHIIKIFLFDMLSTTSKYMSECNKPQTSLKQVIKERPY